MLVGVDEVLVVVGLVLVVVGLADVVDVTSVVLVELVVELVAGFELELLELLPPPLEPVIVVSMVTVAIQHTATYSRGRTQMW